MSSCGANVEIVQFNERFCGRKVPKNRNKPSKNNPQSKMNEHTSSEVKEFNIRKSRYEIKRFALSGFDAEKQKREKISIAVKLGAKPPKKKYVNYKVLMELKKKEKEERKAKQTDQYTLKQLKGRKKTSKKTRKNPSSIM
ncbi:uncharacterized protein NPIL_462301 [Nephila pilipes]|uniref:Uncharacterized protein n=1 Tax=Nephila pilipes TaxID=299642 RepID=A0A8X6KL12_NEPPI|nr:uncharacterized protein NPIL_462301 [Nephila pilipes]